MKFNKSLLGAALAAVLATAGTAAHADSLTVNLAGWQTTGDFGDPGNTQAFYTLPTGSLVTGFTYSGLTFTAIDPSYLSEFVLSVNNAAGTEYLDWAPSASNAPGTAGPLSGSFGGAVGIGGGGPFTVAPGANNLWVTVYELFTDPGLNATVSAGTLTINYTVAAVPEASTYAMMGLGLLGLGAVARRRKA